MTKQFKPTRLLSGGRVTMPQEWLDRFEIKEGDILLVDATSKHLVITKAKLQEA